MADILYYIAVMSIPMLTIWIIAGYLAMRYESFLFRLFFMLYNIVLLIDCMNCVDRGTLDVIVLFAALLFSAYLIITAEYLNS
jgi:hypothetical protein